MTEHDEPDDKITVLFPDHQGDEEPGEGDGDNHGEPQQESNSGGEVVHLDFENNDSSSDSADQVRGELQPLAGEQVNTTKLKVFEGMIEEGMVMVTLDTRVPGVSVPAKFRGLPELRLNFSHLFHIDDFDYDTEGVRASLSFDGKRYFCDVPWPAVFMLYSHETGEVLVFEPSTPD